MRPRTFLLLILTFSVMIIPSASASVQTSAIPSTGPSSTVLLAAYTYNPCVMCMVAGDVVFFNATTSYAPSDLTIVSYTWDFGDGTPIVKTTGPTVNHMFSNISNPAKWLVTLTVQDLYGHVDTISQWVVFNVLPRFSIVPSKPMAGQPVVFNGTMTIVYGQPSPGPILFSWDFGDGTNGTGGIVKHAYFNPGPYRVVMTVGTSNGNAQISKTLFVVPFISGSLLLNQVFDDVNVTIYGMFTINQTSRTVTGSVTVTATNTTDDTIIFSKSFNVTISYTGQNVRFVFIIPASPVNLGATCMVKGSDASANCFLSRSPDVDRDGRVGIVDFGMVLQAFGARIGTAGYNPSLDLTGSGSVDITDTGIMSADYGVPLYE